jgi:hypothetical protein
MSSYIERPTCTCDTPTGSESRRCSYCLSNTTVDKSKRRKKNKKVKYETK